MKPISISTLFFILLFNISSAQDWKSVRTNDTNYFKEPNTSLIVGLYIDSARQAGSDSIFYFYPSYQYMNSNLGSYCIDTLAPSWLGSYYIRKSNGDEIYQTKTSETWLIKTTSTLNSFWTLQEKNALGYSLEAAVTQIAPLNIHGQLDSIKTIQVTTYKDSLPTSNTFFIRLSKLHGLVEIPNLWYFHLLGTGLPAGYPFVLVDKKLYQLNKSEYDLALEKYQAGNEWITNNRSGLIAMYQFLQTPDSAFSNSNYIRDSIITATPLNSNQIKVVKKSFYYNRFISTVQQNSSIDTSILQFSTNNPVNLLYEIFPTTSFPSTSDKASNFRLYSYLNEENDSLAFLINTYHDDLIIQQDTCYKIMPKEFAEVRRIYRHPFFPDFLSTEIGHEFNSEVVENRLVYYHIGNQTFGSNPLPALEFVLQGIHREKQNELHWKTSGELNTDYFVVERADSKNEFQAIGQQKAAQNANTLNTYSFIDSKVSSDVNTVLYRIKLIDIDRQVSYSNTIALASNKTQEFSISPNPCYDKLNVHYSTNAEIDIDITIRNTIGQIVFNKRHHMTSGNFELPINISHQLTSGLFFYEFTNLTTHEVFKGKLSKL